MDVCIEIIRGNERVVKAELGRAGNILADADLMIAAISLAHSADLVTGNRRHYERIQRLQIEDWIRGQN